MKFTEVTLRCTIIMLKACHVKQHLDSNVQKLTYSQLLTWHDIFTSSNSLSMSVCDIDPLSFSRAFLPALSSLLLMIRYRGDSGMNGRRMICRRAGMPAMPSNTGHPDLDPRILSSPSTWLMRSPVFKASCEEVSSFNMMRKQILTTDYSPFKLIVIT